MEYEEFFVKGDADIGNNPIDIVYLWCDGSDPAFQQRKRQYVPQTIPEELGGVCRHFDNDELKYSLRSLEKHAPWLNHIYIVTDDQTPSWLNTDASQISIVDLTEILPEEALPTFDTDVIEMAIHKVPGLSEFFLYANDDMFFGSEVTPDFFFTSEGFPIIRGDRDVLKDYALGDRDISKDSTNNLYMSNIFRSSFLVWKETGDALLYVPHHNIDSYRKSFFEEAELLFSEECGKTLKKRFRGRGSNLRRIAHFLDYAKGRGVFKQVESYQLSWSSILRNIFPLSGEMPDSFYNDINDLTIFHKKSIKAGKYKLFCLNDGAQATDADRIAVKKFMEDLFPKPSAFEIL